MKIYDFHGFPVLGCSFAELVETWSVPCHGDIDCVCRNKIKIWCTDLKIWKNGSGARPSPARWRWLVAARRDAKIAKKCVFAHIYLWKTVRMEVSSENVGTFELTKHAIFKLKINIFKIYHKIYKKNLKIMLSIWNMQNIN